MERFSQSIISEDFDRFSRRNKEEEIKLALGIGIKYHRDMKIQTGNAMYEFKDGVLIETERVSGKTREIGEGEIAGFGIFTGLCPEEEPNILSQEPEEGLQFFFKKTGSELPFDFVSEPLI